MLPTEKYRDKPLKPIAGRPDYEVSAPMAGPSDTFFDTPIDPVSFDVAKDSGIGIFSEDGVSGISVDSSGETAVGWYSMDGKPLDVMASPYKYGLKTGTGLRFVEVAPEIDLADDTKTSLDTSFESDERITDILPKDTLADPFGYMKVFVVDGGIRTPSISSALSTSGASTGLSTGSSTGLSTSSSPENTEGE